MYDAFGVWLNDQFITQKALHEALGSEYDVAILLGFSSH